MYQVSKMGFTPTLDKEPQKQPLSCKHEVAVYFVFYALSSKLSCRLLDDCSNTA